MAMYAQVFEQARQLVGITNIEPAGKVQHAFGLPPDRQHGCRLAQQLGTPIAGLGPQYGDFARARQQRLIFIDKRTQPGNLLTGVPTRGLAVHHDRAHHRHGQQGEGACAHRNGERRCAGKAGKAGALREGGSRRHQGKGG
jgi:hypothetical protein